MNDSRQTFSPQSDINETRNLTGVLRFLSDYWPRHILNELNKHHVRPHIYYGDDKCHMPQKPCDFSLEVTVNRQMERLESVE